MNDKVEFIWKAKKNAFQMKINKKFKSWCVTQSSVDDKYYIMFHHNYGESDIPFDTFEEATEFCFTEYMKIYEEIRKFKKFWKHVIDN